VILIENPKKLFSLRTVLQTNGKGEMFTGIKLQGDGRGGAALPNLALPNSRARGVTVKETQGKEGRDSKQPQSESVSGKRGSFSGATRLDEGSKLTRTELLKPPVNSWIAEEKENCKVNKEGNEKETETPFCRRTKPKGERFLSSSVEQGGNQTLV